MSDKKKQCEHEDEALTPLEAAFRAADTLDRWAMQLGAKGARKPSSASRAKPSSKAKGRARAKSKSKA